MDHAPLEHLLDFTLKAGADATDGVYAHSTDIDVSCRLGKPETLQRSENSAIGIRALCGQKQATISTTDFSSDHLKELAEQVVAIAKASTEDAHIGLAPDELLATNIKDLDLADNEEPTTEWLLAQCMAAEEAALAVKGVTNSEGADAGYGAYNVTLMTRPSVGAGFTGSYNSTSFSVSSSVIAGVGDGMETDYDYSSVLHRSDLEDSATIGTSAGMRTVKRLGSRKAATGEYPVIFDPRVGRSLLGSFASAISGAAIARGTSFLKESMGQKIFADGITISDDPHRLRGLGSKPFDGEGVQNAAQNFIEDGTLTQWLLDMRTASKLGLKTNGMASRGIGGSPSPSTTNFTLHAGHESPEALIQSIKNGFFVTETFGMGINLITGDYSQGASGFWIENGEISYPVSEVTIASTLQNMFKTLTPASDVTTKYATNVPTLLIDKMTVAGS